MPPKTRSDYIIDGHPRTVYRGYIYLYACYMNIIFQVVYLVSLVAHGIMPDGLFVATSTCYCVVVAIHCSICVEYHMLDIHSESYDISLINYELCIQKYDYIFAYALNVTSCILFDAMFVIKEENIHNLHAVLFISSVFKVTLFIAFANGLKIPASNQWNEFIMVGVILSATDAAIATFLTVYYYYGYIKHRGILVAFITIVIIAITSTSTYVAGRLLGFNKSPRFNTHDIMHAGIIAAIVVSYISIGLFVFDKI